MRNAVGFILMATVGMWWVGGCAQPKMVTLPPSEDELPRIVENEPVSSLRVGVEGRRDEPQALLVPPLKEPELTPEEHEAMGEAPEPINWLEFYQPQPKVVKVCPDAGGVSTGLHGVGGALVGLTPFKSPFAAIGRAGSIQAVYSERGARFGQVPVLPKVGRGSDVGGVSVGVTPARGISAHQDHRGP